jgi:hypothetical protein
MDILITISVWLGWLGAAISIVGGIVVLRYQVVRRKRAKLSVAPGSKNKIKITIEIGTMRHVIEKVATGDQKKDRESIIQDISHLEW